MTSVSYAYTRKLEGVDFDEALRRVPEALKKEGFGILTEIDVKATLKKKIDVDFKRYTILGACNPPFAHKALTAEPLIGLLLPCNVVVHEDDGGTVVSIAKPKEMFRIVDNKELAGIADEVDARLQRALEAV